MYRICFEPKGYVITLIYNDPEDQQIDFDADMEFDAFVEKFIEIFDGLSNSSNV